MNVEAAIRFLRARADEDEGDAVMLESRMRAGKLSPADWWIAPEVRSVVGRNRMVVDLVERGWFQAPETMLWTLLQRYSQHQDFSAEWSIDVSPEPSCVRDNEAVR